MPSLSSSVSTATSSSSLSSTPKTNRSATSTRLGSTRRNTSVPSSVGPITRSKSAINNTPSRLTRSSTISSQTPVINKRTTLSTPSRAHSSQKPLTNKKTANITQSAKSSIKPPTTPSSLRSSRLVTSSASQASKRPNTTSTNPPTKRKLTNNGATDQSDNPTKQRRILKEPSSVQSKQNNPSTSTPAKSRTTRSHEAKSSPITRTSSRISSKNTPKSSHTKSIPTSKLNISDNVNQSPPSHVEDIISLPDHSLLNSSPPVVELSNDSILSHTDSSTTDEMDIDPIAPQPSNEINGDVNPSDDISNKVNVDTTANEMNMDSIAPQPLNEVNGDVNPSNNSSNEVKLDTTPKQSKPINVLSKNGIGTTSNAPNFTYSSPIPNMVTPIKSALRTPNRNVTMTPGRILFSPHIRVMEIEGPDDYDRSPLPNTTRERRATGRIPRENWIKLNRAMDQFKQTEMPVHPDSTINTKIHLSRIQSISNSPDDTYINLFETSSPSSSGKQGGLSSHIDRISPISSTPSIAIPKSPLANHTFKSTPSRVPTTPTPASPCTMFQGITDAVCQMIGIITPSRINDENVRQ